MKYEQNNPETNYKGRQNNIQEQPEVVKNELYTPGFLKRHIGRLLRVEFLIGTSYLEDRVGILMEVGASYIVLKSIQDRNLMYCDIYSIKFVTISQDSYLHNAQFQV